MHVKKSFILILLLAQFFSLSAQQVSVTFRSTLSSFNEGRIYATGAGTDEESVVTLNPYVGWDVYAEYNEDTYYNEYNGYTYIFNDTEAPLNKSKWTRQEAGDSPIDHTSSVSFTRTITSSDNYTIYKAELRKYCEATFTSNYSGASIKINGVSQSVPVTEEVVEENLVTAKAPSQFDYSNRLYRQFKYWAEDGDSVSGSVQTNFYLTAHTNYQAVFKTFPYSLSPIYCISDVGDPITIQWNEHPHSGVTRYDIYRKKKNDLVGVKIGTVYKQSNSGTLTFTDNLYCRSNDTSDDLLSYDARPYYAPDNTIADPNYRRAVYGEILFKNGNDITENTSIITEYALGNYPNPFNPTTTVNYQLPSAGFVTIKVYDMLGKQVASLVNEMKQCGAYNATFNANNLSSGTYLLNIQVKAVGSGSKDFVDTKKILLLK